MNNHSYRSLIILAVSAVALVKVASTYWRPGPGKRTDPEPIAKPLMTAREEALMDALEILLPAYRIHAQVAMGALLMPPRHTDRRMRHVARNGFSQKIVDFVVQDRTTGKVVALIEIDDWSHRAERDRRRDAMTDCAGYRTLRIPRSTIPTVAEVMPFVERLICESKVPHGH